MFILFLLLINIYKVFSLCQQDLKCQLVPKNPNKIPRVNGCGSNDMNPVLKQFINVPVFEECCNQHDRDYEDCSKSKEISDKIFEECMRNSCVNYNSHDMNGYKGMPCGKGICIKPTEEDSLRECYTQVNIYMLGLSTNKACNSWKNSINENCKCREVTPGGFGSS